MSSPDPADQGHPSRTPKGAQDHDWNYYFRRKERRQLIYGVLAALVVLSLAAAIIFFRFRGEFHYEAAPDGAPREYLPTEED